MKNLLPQPVYAKRHCKPNSKKCRWKTDYSPWDLRLCGTLARSLGTLHFCIIIIIIIMSEWNARFIASVFLIHFIYDCKIDGNGASNCWQRICKQNIDLFLIDDYVGTHSPTNRQTDSKHMPFAIEIWNAKSSVWLNAVDVTPLTMLVHPSAERINGRMNVSLFCRGHRWSYKTVRAPTLCWK